jgi:hypothetical protein
MAISKFSNSSIANGFPKYPNFWDKSTYDLRYKTNLQVWLDASDSSTISYSSGSLVSQWNDKSGNGYNFTQSNSSKQPTLTTGLQNGKPGIKFYDNGTAGKWLSNTSFNFDNGAFTFFIVYNGTRSSSNYPALLGRESSGAVQLGGNASAPTGLAISKIGTATQSTNLSYTGWNADVAVYKASSGISGGSLTVQCYLNGTAASATVTQTGLGSGTATSIGASNGGAGDSMNANAYICEIIVYNAALSDTDRNLVEAYLKAKWGTV